MPILSFAQEVYKLLKNKYKIFLKDFITVLNEKDIAVNPNFHNENYCAMCGLFYASNVMRDYVINLTLWTDLRAWEIDEYGDIENITVGIVSEHYKSFTIDIDDLYEFQESKFVDPHFISKKQIYIFVFTFFFLFLNNYIWLAFIYFFLGFPMVFRSNVEEEKGDVIQEVYSPIDECAELLYVIDFDASSFEESTFFAKLKKNYTINTHNYYKYYFHYNERLKFCGKWMYFNQNYDTYYNTYNNKQLYKQKIMNNDELWRCFYITTYINFLNRYCFIQFILYIKQNSKLLNLKNNSNFELFFKFNNNYIKNKLTNDMFLTDNASLKTYIYNDILYNSLNNELRRIYFSKFLKPNDKIKLLYILI